jgi:hypothetical protein
MRRKPRQHLPKTWMVEERKAFFFEKEKQKTFATCRASPGAQLITGRGNKRKKVFWFFFSKKNILHFLYIHPLPPGGR